MSNQGSTKAFSTSPRAAVSNRGSGQATPGTPRPPPAAGGGEGQGSVGRRCARARSRDCTRRTSTSRRSPAADGPLRSIFIIQMGQQVGAPPQGGHGVESQTKQQFHKHLPPGGVQVHQPL